MMMMIHVNNDDLMLDSVATALADRFFPRLVDYRYERFSLFQAE